MNVLIIDDVKKRFTNDFSCTLGCIVFEKYFIEMNLSCSDIERNSRALAHMHVHSINSCHQINKKLCSFY